MPGVPFEMKQLFHDQVRPKIVSSFTRPVLLHRTLITYGLGESAIAERLEAWEDTLNTGKYGRNKEVIEALKASYNSGSVDQRYCGSLPGDQSCSPLKRNFKSGLTRSNHLSLISFLEKRTGSL